jgi:hypothetical protein
MNRTAELREMKKRLGEIVERHEKLQNSYFWSPNRNANGRRNTEKRYNDIYENKMYGIYAENRYRESCKNVYYKGIFYLDGKKTTVTKIKNIISALDYIC